MYLFKVGRGEKIDSFVRPDLKRERQLTKTSYTHIVQHFGETTRFERYDKDEEENFDLPKKLNQFIEAILKNKNEINIQDLARNKKILKFFEPVSKNIKVVDDCLLKILKT